MSTKIEDTRILMNQISMIAQLLIKLDMEDYLRAASYSDTIGPIIDPTLWIKANKSLSEWVRLASILSKAKNEIIKDLPMFSAHSKVNE